MDPFFGTSERSVTRCLGRIERHDGELRAFITVMAGQALDDARAADRAAARGDWLGLLHGVPVALKDSIAVAGVPCTSGSAYFADYVPERDAALVTRLKAAGAVLLGKTNLHEFCYGGTTQNETYGSCRNPWDRRLVPGGSSGGSAVAVAAGMSPLAIGGDTGASIRGPAALNGIAGLRPTAGAVPNTGALPVSAPYDTHGPMARRVADLARVFAAIAGYDPDDPLSEDRPPPDVLSPLKGGVAGVRVLVPTNFFFDDLAEGYAEAVLEAARVLERLGARLLEGTIPGLGHAQEALNHVLYADAACLHREKLEESPERIGRLVRERLRPGFELSGAAYAGHRRWLEGWEHAMRAFFAERADLVLSPTTPCPPIPVDRTDDVIGDTARLSRLGWAWAAARLPALTVPCGFDPAGLPIGVQLAAARWGEPLLLRAGHAYQGATEWHLAEPPGL
jgi:aspartyl-tRNA(Asn)/glutamyl-tRNA(Gln) amidotransferase subunit A